MNNIAFFIIDYSTTGGVARVNASLLQLFSQHGMVANHLFTLRSALAIPELAFPPNINVTVLNKLGSEAELAQTLATLLTQYQISTLLYQGDNMTIALHVQQACALAGCKGILHYHGSPFGYLKKYIYVTDLAQNPLVVLKLVWSIMQYPFKKLKLKKVVAQATDGFVCVSHGVERELRLLYKNNPRLLRGICTIPNPVAFSAALQSNAAKENKVVYISRLERKHKNSMMVVRVWKLLGKEFPHWQLQILGDGILMNVMKKYCSDNDLPNVQFWGMTSRVAEVLTTSSISMLTSDCEGLGMGLVESAAYRNALVTTAADGGVTDIVENNYSGFVTARNNDAAMAAGLSKLMQSAELRETFGNNAAEKLIQMQDDTVAEAWKQLFKTGF